jgi:hypothetical protein
MRSAVAHQGGPGVLSEGDHDVTVKGQDQATAVRRNLLFRCDQHVPLDLRMCGCQSGREAFRRFTEDFDIANDRVLRLGIGEKLTVCDRCGVALDADDRFAHVSEVFLLPSFRHARAFS